MVSRPTVPGVSVYILCDRGFQPNLQGRADSSPKGKSPGQRDEASGVRGFGGCALQWQALRDTGTMGTVSLQQASVILR